MKRKWLARLLAVALVVSALQQSESIVSAVEGPDAVEVSDETQMPGETENMQVPEMEEESQEEMNVASMGETESLGFRETGGNEWAVESIEPGAKGETIAAENLDFPEEAKEQDASETLEDGETGESTESTEGVQETEASEADGGAIEENGNVGLWGDAGISDIPEAIGVTEADLESTEDENALVAYAEDDIASGSYGDIVWVIDASGKLTVSGTGDYADPTVSAPAQSPWYEYREKIISAEINVTGMTNASYMFYGCGNMISADLDNFDTSNVTDMGYMFCYCSSLTNLDVSNFITDSVTNMEYMFYDCEQLTNLNVSNFDTSKVADMSYMFFMCCNLANLDVSNFNTGNVSSTGGMFNSCSSLTNLNVSNFITDKVTNMNWMFSGCKNLTNLDVSNFKTSNVIEMQSMFIGCNNLKNLDIRNFETGNVRTMRHMFSDCNNLTELNISSFDTSKVTDMYGMFAGCSNLSNLDLSKFNTENVTDMGELVYMCESLQTLHTPQIMGSNMNVTAMLPGTFSDPDGNKTEELTSSFANTVLTKVSELQTGYVNGTNEMVTWTYEPITKTTVVTGKGTRIELPSSDSSCFPAETKYIRFEDCEIEGSLSELFRGLKNVILIDFSGLKTFNITSMGCMFYDCCNLRELDLSNFDTTNVIDMSGMFVRCIGLTKLDLENFNTENVIFMDSMFSNCENLIELNLDNFNTSKVSHMNGMFLSCHNLKKLDLSSFNTGNVVDMQFMFTDCINMTELELGSFDTSNVTNMSYMFSGCSRMVNLDVSNFDTTKVTAMGEFVFLCDSLKTLHTPKVMGSNITVTAFLPATFADPNGNTTTILTAEFADTVLTRVPEIQTGVVDGTNDMVTWTYDPNTKITVVTGKGIRAGVQSADIPRFPVETGYIRFEDCEIEGSMKELFKGMSNLNTIDFTGLKAVNVTDMSSMFMECGSLIDLDMAIFDTGNVTNMNSIFAGCSKLKKLDLAGFDTGKVTDISGMFSGCSDLTELNLAGFNTSNVTYMSAMFWGCNSLAELDLTGFDTVKVTNMRYMFYGCGGLRELNLANFDTSNITDMNDMASIFSGCDSLQTLHTPQVIGSVAAALPGTYSAPDGSQTEELTAAFANVILTRTGSETPEPTESPEPTETPEPTELPDPTETPDPTGSPEPTEIPDPTESPLPTEIPQATESPVPTETPEPTEPPVPTGTPEPTESPLPTEWPEPTETPEPIESPHPGVQTGVVDRTEERITWIYYLDTKTVVVTGKGTRASMVGRSAYSGVSCFPQEAEHVRFEACEITGSLDGLFAGLEQLTSVDFTGLRMADITDMSHMFAGCSGLSELNLGNFDTGKVTNMKGMFSECSGLKELDLSNFDAANVTDVENIFEGCNSLVAINVPYRMAKSVVLPFAEGTVWLLPDGTEITELPQNLDYSVMVSRQEIKENPNPVIITTTPDLIMDDVVRVKYVPYSYTIETNNNYEGNTVTFSIESGRLAEGLLIYPATGEIYGVPMETGEFPIRVKATYSDPRFLPSYADITVTVIDNTNGNVFAASDVGYELLQPVGEQMENGEFVITRFVDRLFVSAGQFHEFVDLWLNGERLIDGVDYTKESGSTRITVMAQSFENKANREGVNTIAAEFRVDGDKSKELKRTAQNFRIDIRQDNDADDDESDSNQSGNSSNGSVSETGDNISRTQTQTVSPQTGDEAKPGLWFVLAVISLGSGYGVYHYDKKKKRTESKD